MSARILDGTAVAQAVQAEVAQRVTALAERAGVVPGLAVILAGDDNASGIYVRNKARAAEAVGIAARTLRFGADVTADTLLATIDALNADRTVHGILVQLPLPAGLPTEAILDRVDPAKDVDGFHPVNQGRLATGRPGFVPCTPAGCMRLFREADVTLAGRRAVVIGRSTIVGRPMAALLLQADATVTICHSRTPDLAAVVREADVVVSAVGRARMVKASWIRPGAAVLDVGMNRDEAGRLCGDVDFDAVREVAGVLSPVPRGVGPMTIAMLMENVCRSAELMAPA